MAKLAMSVPAPRVNFAKSGAGDRMSVAALNLIDPLAHLLETGHNFGDVVGIAVAKTELPVGIVFAHCIGKALHRYKEPEVVATRNTRYLDAFTEWHSHWSRVILTPTDKRPREGVTRLGTGKGKCATRRYRGYLMCMPREKVHSLRRKRVPEMAQPKLAFFVGAPDNQVARLGSQHQTAVIYCYYLLDANVSPRFFSAHKVLILRIISTD